MSWAGDTHRIGLGCMRFSTEPTRDEAGARATIEAAYDAGIRIFDTARAYCVDDDERGHNERLLASVLRDRPGVRIVTKGGMTRPGGRWVPDGRAKAIAADAAASAAALEVDLYLLHAPDPEVDFAVSVRALAALLDKGVVKNVGLSNVSRAQLDLALTIAPIAAVELSLGWFDDKALDAGVVARCLERDITVLAHRPLGGVKKHRALERDRALTAVAARSGPPTAPRWTPAQVALAAVLDLDERIVALPGPTTPAHAREAAAATALVLDDAARGTLATKLDRARVHGPVVPRDLVDASDGEVVLLMGIQGAGKTDALSTWLARGYERINRDERGGTMRSLHAHLDERLVAGSRRVVLDNTYVTRAVRRAAIDVAWRHRLPVRGIWFDTPLASAQVNVVLRMLAHHHRLLEPHEMGGGPESLPPHAQHRLLRTLEPPALDEGWSTLDVVPFARRPSPHTNRARFVALDALVDARGALHEDATLRARLRGSIRGAPTAADAPVLDVATLVFAWTPGRAVDDVVAARVRAAVGHDVAFATCAHPAGPPICWCRPPMPGLLLAYAAAHGVDPAESVVVGAGPAHRAMAAALGARFEDVGADRRGAEP